MHYAFLYEKIIKKIKLLEKTDEKYLDNLTFDKKSKFRNQKEFEITLKIKEFIDNIIAIKKEEINNPNLKYKILINNIEVFKILLINCDLLEKNETLESIYKN